MSYYGDNQSFFEDLSDVLSLMEEGDPVVVELPNGRQYTVTGVEGKNNKIVITADAEAVWGE